MSLRASDKARAFSAALRLRIFHSQPFLGETAPFLPGMLPAVCCKVALVCTLVAQFPQEPDDHSGERAQPFHISSGRRRETTNGDSVILASRVPRSIPTHRRTESMRIKLTSTRKIPQTT